MNGTKIIRAIVKLYFVGAVTASFTHLMNASVKLGAAPQGWERIAAPVAIDLAFIVAMVLRSEQYASDTRRIGFRLMLVMGSISMAGNIYAGSSAFGYIFGAMLPSFLLMSEWLITKIRTAAQERADERDAAVVAEAEAIAAAGAWRAQCSHPTRCTTEAQCRTKAAARAKAAKTRAHAARARKAQERALEALVNA